MSIYKGIKEEIGNSITLVAVSKTKPIEQIMELYELGQRDFGENRAQELTEKFEQLPKDIRWHMIGHLQKNKVKYIAPFISLIQSVDSIELLDKIEHEAQKNDRRIPILLQYRIAKEETKFGLTKSTLLKAADYSLHKCPNVQLLGLMGLASLTDNEKVIRSEFNKLNILFNELKHGILKHVQSFKIKSMGMSGDYKLAIDEGSNMLRIGTLLFGQRN